MGLFSEPIILDGKDVSYKRPEDAKLQDMTIRPLFKPWDCKMSDEEWDQHCIELDRQERFRRYKARITEDFLDAGF